MIKKLIKLFSAGSKQEESPASVHFDKTGQAIDHELMVAIAVLLVQVASADQDIAREEAQTICEIIAFSFNFPEENIPALVEEALVARREKIKVNDFLDLINARFSQEQKITVLAMMWKVANADSKLEKYEEKLVYRYRTMLHLDEASDLKAQKFAATGMV